LKQTSSNPEREVYSKSTKDNDDWGKIARSYGRQHLKEDLEHFNGLVNEQKGGVRSLEAIPFAQASGL
jgi:hypothetical protein